MTIQKLTKLVGIICIEISICVDMCGIDRTVNARGRTACSGA